MSMSSSIREPSYRSSTSRVCDHVQSHVDKTEHIADIYVKKMHDFLDPLELFKAGQKVMKVGYQWVWLNRGSYNIPVRRISHKKFELILEV